MITRFHPVLAWSFCAIGLLTTAPCGENVSENGATDDGPITRGYLFVGEEFVAGPYSVAVDGQTVTVNGQVVFQCHTKPSRIVDAAAQIAKDPGPPPTGLSPLNDSEAALDYWVDKSRYLKQAHDLDTARRLFVEAVEQSQCGVTAWLDASHPNGVMLKGAGAITEYFPISNDRSFKPDPDPVASAERFKKSQAWLLKKELSNGRVVWIVDQQGSITLVRPDKTEDFLRIMTDGSGVDIILVKMATLNALNLHDGQWNRILREFTDWNALREYHRSAPILDAKNPGKTTLATGEAPSYRDRTPPKEAGVNASDARITPPTFASQHWEWIAAAVGSMAILLLLISFNNRR
jgi:hypothetical protein